MLIQNLFYFTEASASLYAQGRPAYGDQPVGEGGGRRRALPGPAGGDGYGQDGHDGQCHRPDRPAGAGARPQQEIGGAAV